VRCAFSVVRWRALALVVMAHTPAESERFLLTLREVLAARLDGPVKSIEVLRDHCRVCVEQAYERWAPAAPVSNVDTSAPPPPRDTGVSPLSPSKVNWDPKVAMRSLAAAPRQAPKKEAPGAMRGEGAGVVKETGLAPEPPSGIDWEGASWEQFREAAMGPDARLPAQKKRPTTSPGLRRASGGGPGPEDGLPPPLLDSPMLGKSHSESSSSAPRATPALIPKPSQRTSSDSEGSARSRAQSYGDTSWETVPFTPFGKPSSSPGAPVSRGKAEAVFAKRTVSPVLPVQQQRQTQPQPGQAPVPQRQQQPPQEAEGEQDPDIVRGPSGLVQSDALPQPSREPSVAGSQQSVTGSQQSAQGDLFLSKASNGSNQSSLADMLAEFDSTASAESFSQVSLMKSQGGGRGHRRHRTWATSRQSPGSTQTTPEQVRVESQSASAPSDFGAARSASVNATATGTECDSENGRPTRKARSMSSRFSPSRVMRSERKTSDEKKPRVRSLKGLKELASVPGGSKALANLFQQTPSPTSRPLRPRAPSGYNNLSVDSQSAPQGGGDVPFPLLPGESDMDAKKYVLPGSEPDGSRKERRFKISRQAFVPRVSSPLKEGRAFPRPSIISKKHINEALGAEFQLRAAQGQAGYTSAVPSRGSAKDAGNSHPMDPNTYGISHQIPEKKVLKWAKPKGKGTSGSGPAGPGHRRSASASNGGSNGSVTDSIGDDAEGVRILIPLDYSGMEDAGGEGSVPDNAPPEVRLVSLWDVQTLNALKTQVQLCKERRALLTVMHLFRDFLHRVPLPRPLAVQAEQALKDAGRERVRVNGVPVEGNADVLRETVREALLSLVDDSNDVLVNSVVTDVMRASSRTAHGGDAYLILQSLFVRQADDGMPVDLLTPSPEQPPPIEVTVNPNGFISIQSTDRFLLRDAQAIMMGELEDGVDDDDEADSEEKHNRKFLSRIKNVVTGRRQHHVHKYQYVFDNPEKCIHLDTQVEVMLGLLDGGSWERTIRIACPQVENIPAQCIFLGAAHAPANGSYDLQGFAHGKPWYLNRHGYTLRYAESEKVSLGKLPCPRWEVIGSAHHQRPIYGAAPDSLPPPHPWVVLLDGVLAQVLSPAPTLMHNFSDAHLVSRSCSNPNLEAHLSDGGASNPAAGYRLAPKSAAANDAAKRAQFYQNLGKDKPADPFSNASLIAPVSSPGEAAAKAAAAEPDDAEEEDCGDNELASRGSDETAPRGSEDALPRCSDETVDSRHSAVNSPRPSPRPSPGRPGRSPGIPSRYRGLGMGRKEKAATNPKANPRLRPRLKFWKKHNSGDTL